MNVKDLYTFLEAEFGNAFKREDRNDGRAYYWREIKKAPRSTRLLRVRESATGDAAEIKLAQSSITAPHDVLLSLSTSQEEVASAVHAELSRLLSK
jgi:hypothetical protein